MTPSSKTQRKRPGGNPKGAPQKRSAARAAKRVTPSKTVSEKNRKPKVPRPVPSRAANVPSRAPGVIASFVVPHMPHPLLVPEANPGYGRIREAYLEVGRRIRALKPDLLILYSTQWPSVIGHQVQVDPEPQWIHVDQEWHELGAIPYRLRMDAEFGKAYVESGQRRGLEMRGVSYTGFPVDTGSIVALKLLTPKNEIPASIVSCNMYADRAETIVLGKAARDALKRQGKRAVAIAVTALSNRLFSGVIPFSEDRIHSRKDDEWNRKYLEFLRRGRLEDASQLAREFSGQANGDSKLKAVWWLAAVSGAHNHYEGEVLAYEAIYGTGAAVAGLTPSRLAAHDKEFDEDEPEVHHGDRNVLGGANAFEAGNPGETWSGAHSSADLDIGAGYPGAPSSPVIVPEAPRPVGAYAHARRVGDLLFLAGIGPRIPETDEVPGGPVRDAKGKARPYDVRAQTRQAIKNVEAVLRGAGASLADVLDVQVYLTDMKRDFAAFNEEYNRAFAKIGATRTTVEVGALPTPIAVEFKVVARAAPIPL
ncbi:MAG: Rid family hydrolase [Thermoplasmatota archaeon]